ncbi:MAG TPA: tRNA lysidine(34) synthetase TilS [Bacteroidales bacterium]|nr:tRNA lysidine(34) synthetase TilS [Bacteroidales bacterium]
MLEKVREYIQKENLIKDNTKIIVGLSGGMDSMVLLDILTLLGYSCIAAHCNFHLRGEESNRDEIFVKKWCKSIDIPFTSINFDTNQYALDRKISIEMAARELRYNWFETLRKHYQANYIAVAHHKDDSVETVLLNLIRGTGIKGLTGISAKNGHVVRPLLCISRLEIEKYILERDIPHVTDSTNSEDLYLRNSLRLNVLPLLETLNPSVKDTIYRTSRNLTEAEKIYSESIQKSIKDVFSDNKIDINKLRQTASPRSVLFELLTTYNFTPSTIEDISESIDSISGKIFYSDSGSDLKKKKYRLIKDRNYFLLDVVNDIINDNQTYLIEEETTEIDFPINLKIREISSPKDIIYDSRFLYIDADKIKYPLVLRKWRSGDWFIPFGMKGRKKLSDYFSDRKFSLKDKEDAWLLASGDDIVWIVGERNDNRFRISEDTIKIISIEQVC